MNYSLEYLNVNKNISINYPFSLNTKCVVGNEMRSNVIVEQIYRKY